MTGGVRRLIALCLMLALVLKGADRCRAGDTSAVWNGAAYPLDAKAIDLGDARVDDWDAFAAFLDRFPQLERVDMFAAPVTGRRADALKKAFPRVTFGWTLRITCYDGHEHRVRTDAEVFSTLHSNKSAWHTDEELGVLRYCTGLKALDIGHNRVTDLSFLYDMPELRVLIIAINQVRDLTPVASLRHLEYLEMFRNRVRDLSPLQGLEHLMDLNICYNIVTDVTPLHGMTQLKRLWLAQSAYYTSGKQKGLPRDALRALRSSLPDTVIDSASSPTSGGWREGAHYRVIAEMFRTGTYIPFEDSAQPREFRFAPAE